MKLKQRKTCKHLQCQNVGISNLHLLWQTKQKKSLKKEHSIIFYIGHDYTRSYYVCIGLARTDTTFALLWCMLLWISSLQMNKGR